MLKSKRDEAIKRYLAKIGKLETRARIYNSRYYKILYTDEYSISVRFSDHFHNAENANVEIIKTSLGFYTIKLTKTGINFTVTEDLVLVYLKSIFLIYPEIESGVNTYKEAAQNAVAISIKSNNEADNLRGVLKREKDRIKNVDKICKKNKELSRELATTRNQLNIALDNYKRVKNKLAEIKAMF